MIVKKSLMDIKFHVVYKDLSEDLFSKGENVTAEDAISALNTFNQQKPGKIFMALYSLEEMARLESLQNSYNKLSS